jgi:hypothetical protein
MDGGKVFLLVVLLSTGLIGLAVVMATAARSFGGWAALLAGFGLASTVIAWAQYRSGVLKLRYQAEVAYWTAMMGAWGNAMACLRCYGAFFPAFGPGELIPISNFKAAIVNSAPPPVTG